jgi:hypothetical protein
MRKLDCRTIVAGSLALPFSGRGVRACSTRWAAGVARVMDTIHDRHFGKVEWARHRVHDGRRRFDHME